jgi:DNA-binding Lrp family transcriptional regulator
LEINIWVKNTNEFYRFYNNFMDKYAEYVMDKNVSFITKIYLFSHEHIHKNKWEIILGNEKTVKKIDEIDLLIFNCLLENPLMELLSISGKLKMQASTIHNRIKNLRKKNIFKGCIPVLNTGIIGYGMYRVEITLTNPSQKKSVIEYLTTIPNVLKITELIGRGDLDFEIEFKTPSELDMFLEDLRLKIPQIKYFQVVNMVMD